MVRKAGLLIVVCMALGAGPALAAGTKTVAVAPPKPANVKPADTDMALPGDPIYGAFDSGRYIEAKTLAEEAAAKGDGPSHTLLGQMYEQGLGVAQDYDKAAEWYSRGAALGEVHSQFSLGVMLAEGRGIKMDKKKAADFFELAAARNHAVALYNLSLIYVDGVARPQDFAKAAELMEKAANFDYAPAQYDLAAFYKEGRGVFPSEDKTVYWLGKAAESGYANAELEYGILLFNGRGIAKNEKAGIEFIRSSAEKGNPVAQNRLARAYAFGAGVSVDALVACKWHLLSREAGVSDFRMDDFMSRLSADDRVKVEKAADQWQESMAALLQ